MGIDDGSMHGGERTDEIVDRGFLPAQLSAGLFGPDWVELWIRWGEAWVSDGAMSTGECDIPSVGAMIRLLKYWNEASRRGSSCRRM